MTRDTQNGAAWYDSDYGRGEVLRYAHSDLAKLAATCYYNDMSWQQMPNGFALPLVRMNESIKPENPRWWENVCHHLGEAYTGPLITINEPERSDQDNIPHTTGRWFVKKIATRLPRAKLVFPNVVANGRGYRWLSAFLATRKVPQPYAWGIHIYESSGTDARVILDKVTQVITMHGYKADRFWITEIGYAHNRPETRAVMRGWLDVLRADERVEKIFGYTARGAAVATFDMIGADGRLTATGEEFVR